MSRLNLSFFLAVAILFLSDPASSSKALHGADLDETPLKFPIIYGESEEHGYSRQCGATGDDRFSETECPIIRRKDGLPHEATDPQSCASLCLNHLRCRSWSFRQGKCSLFKWTLRPHPDATSTSGEGAYQITLYTK